MWAVRCDVDGESNQADAPVCTKSSADQREEARGNPARQLMDDRLFSVVINAVAVAWISGPILMASSTGSFSLGQKILDSALVHFVRKFDVAFITSGLPIGEVMTNKMTGMKFDAVDCVECGVCLLEC